MSIFPYIYYMVLSFNITHDERQVAIYAGMVTSSFALAEFSASVFWGRLSDRIGRKPVLLTGLAGTGISMLVFGFARNLPVALLARFLGGILNGYIFPRYIQTDRLLMQFYQQYWCAQYRSRRGRDRGSTSTYVF